MLTILIAAGVAAAPTDSGFTKSGLWYRADGAGPAVVLVHGSNLDSRSWTRVAGALTPGHRVVLVDLRFHGKSRDDGGPFSFEGDLEEVLDALKIERAAIVGHSLGATVAIDFALARPNRVDRLVLIGPAVSGKMPSRMAPGFEGVAAALKAGNLEQAGDALAAMPVMTLYRRPERQPEVAAMVRANVRLFAVDRSRARPLGAPAVNRLGEITVPVLVLVGDKDPTEAADAARAIVDGARQARQTMLAGCGHLVPIDCEAETIDAIRGFLR
jgi:pimeloyl-ACP methyl ester carboxylesterase